MDLQIASSHRPPDDVGLAAKYILIQRAEMDGLMAGHLYVQQGLTLSPEQQQQAVTGRLRRAAQRRVGLCENVRETGLGTDASGQFYKSGLLRVEELRAVGNGVFHLSALCTRQ